MKTGLTRKDYNEKEFKGKIVAALKKRPKGATLSDVVGDTGLSMDWADYTLRQLLNDYPAHLEINQSKELVYLFDFSPRQKSGMALIQDVFFTILNGIWQGFVFLFKGWILFMLFTYLLFNALVLVIGFTALTRSGAIIEAALKGVGQVFNEAVGMLFRKRGKKAKQVSEENSGQGLIQEVFSYVFGETRKIKDDLALEKRILSFIRNNGGKINVAQLVQITGWSLRQAEEEAAQLMAQYQGDAQVSEEGVISYIFPELREEKQGLKKESLMIWNNPIPKRKMNDNDKKTNTNITWVNGFNLIMSIVTPMILIAMFMEEEEEFSDFIFFATCIFPLLFSILFYLVPTLRRPFVNYQNRKINKINQRYTMLGKVFQQLPQAIYPDKSPLKLSDLSANQSLDLLKEQAIALEAEIQTDASGSVYYDFDRINRELGLGD